MEKIYISWPDGQRFAVKIRKKHFHIFSIEQLKQKIQRRTGISLNHQVLTHRRRDLRDEKTLKFYRICPRTKLYLRDTRRAFNQSGASGQSNDKNENSSSEVISGDEMYESNSSLSTSDPDNNEKSIPKRRSKIPSANKDNSLHGGDNLSHFKQSNWMQDIQSWEDITYEENTIPSTPESSPETNLQIQSLNYDTPIPQSSASSSNVNPQHTSYSIQISSNASPLRDTSLSRNLSNVHSSDHLSTRIQSIGTNNTSTTHAEHPEGKVHSYSKSSNKIQSTEVQYKYGSNHENYSRKSRNKFFAELVPTLQDPIQDKSDIVSNNFPGRTASSNSYERVKFYHPTHKKTPHIQPTSKLYTDRSREGYKPFLLSRENENTCVQRNTPSRRNLLLDTHEIDDTYEPIIKKTPHTYQTSKQYTGRSKEGYDAFILSRDNENTYVLRSKSHERNALLDPYRSDNTNHSTDKKTPHIQQGSKQYTDRSREGYDPLLLSRGTENTYVQRSKLHGSNALLNPHEIGNTYEPTPKKTPHIQQASKQRTDWSRPERDPSVPSTGNTTHPYFQIEAYSTKISSRDTYSSRLKPSDEFTSSQRKGSERTSTTKTSKTSSKDSHEVPTNKYLDSKNFESNTQLQKLPGNIPGEITPSRLHKYGREHISQNRNISHHSFVKPAPSVQYPEQSTRTKLTASNTHFHGANLKSTDNQLSSPSSRINLKQSQIVQENSVVPDYARMYAQLRFESRNTSIHSSGGYATPPTKNRTTFQRENSMVGSDTTPFSRSTQLTNAAFPSSRGNPILDLSEPSTNSTPRRETSSRYHTEYRTQHHAPEGHRKQGSSSSRGTCCCCIL